MGQEQKVVVIDYTNWRGERSKRRIQPLRITFGNNEWHPDKQWLLKAIDLDKKEIRFFALANIHSWSLLQRLGG
jgi:predicted DNA-binding transcriptional regulator YafY